MSLKGQGEAAKQEGMERAASGKRREMDALEVVVIRKFLSSPPGTKISVDDVTAPEEMKRAYPDGGKWVGVVFHRMQSKGLIEEVGFVMTVRPSGHRRPVRLWKIASSPKVRMRKRLETLTTKEPHND